jgi:hypothetical protein
MFIVKPDMAAPSTREARLSSPKNTTGILRLSQIDQTGHADLSPMTKKTPGSILRLVAVNIADRL